MEKVDLQATNGCSAGRCGSKAGPADLHPSVWEKVKDHPCYSEEAHHFYARMHVAVAPACNIQCHYCNRKYDCANESRPGVVSERLTPEQAAQRVLAVASRVPQMTVAGIAGPGDSLASAERTFRTLDLIRKAAPDVKLCLSTNGLVLPDYVDRIKELDVDHVTVTVNMIDPEVGERIYPWIYFGGRRWRGKEASRILSERQLEGLQGLAAKGILVKVNSVMIPGVNDEHLVDVNKTVKSLGAFLHNVMPLISAPEHGTHYGLTGQRGPTPQDIMSLQDRLAGQMNVMRHCRQCRADAVGLLGDDRGREFSLVQVEAMEVSYEPEKRKVCRELVETGREAAREARSAARRETAGASPDAKILVAVATKGGGIVNEHFGHAREFQIYEVCAMGARFVGHRRVEGYCEGGYGEDESLDAVIQAIRDCVAVLVFRIGSCPRKALEAAGIDPVDRFAYEYIEKACLEYYGEYVRRAKGRERCSPSEVPAEAWAAFAREG
ncbi:MAG: nitrogenase cofactor biosynthesis protein NifB [Nitrospirae bacterium]|nr:nitrogenase cofactor biosynthesis protein NifB [Nitrospirota bacterium]